LIRAAHPVLLSGKRVGTLYQSGDVARFIFDESYWGDPSRGVLGLWFEDNPRTSPQAALRLPEWFSNLLPEGPLRQWIARDQGVNAERELQLLLRIGGDLPGAVEVLPAEDVASSDVELALEATETARTHAPASLWKFSLAGVGLKFSMLQRGDRLTLPSVGEHGNWIVKFPDAVHRAVPHNEFATMSLARKVGINVPAIELVQRDSLPPVPDLMWPGTEQDAYAIERFDRAATGRIHIEDFAQVRGFYADQKYAGSFETVLGLAYRGHDLASLEEAVRRVTFNLLVGNGDAHLKNWSFIYRDGKRATLSPAYDLVSTAGYYSGNTPEDFGLKFGGTRRMAAMSKSAFATLASALGTDRTQISSVVDETVERFIAAWRDGTTAETFPIEARTWIESNHEDTARRLTTGASRA